MSDIDVLRAEHAGFAARLRDTGAEATDREDVEAYLALCCELRVLLTETALPVQWRYQERAYFDRALTGQVWLCGRVGPEW